MRAGAPREKPWGLRQFTLETSMEIASSSIATERCCHANRLEVLMRIALFLLILAGHDAQAVTTDRSPVAIIGTGTLAGTLGPALGQRGYPVIYGSRDAARETVRDLVKRTGSKA